MICSSQKTTPRKLVSWSSSFSLHIHPFLPKLGYPNSSLSSLTLRLKHLNRDFPEMSLCNSLPAPTADSSTSTGIFFHFLPCHFCLWSSWAESHKLEKGIDFYFLFFFTPAPKLERSNQLFWDYP